MADLEGALLSLRNDLHIVIGRFIADDTRSDRARKSVLLINNILTRDNVSGSNEQLQKLQSASGQIAGVMAGQNARFDNAIETVEDALGSLNP
jgi:hypothetical protein